MTATLMRPMPVAAQNDNQNGDNQNRIADALKAFKHARMQKNPFRHWLFRGALSQSQCNHLIALPIRPAEFDDTYGKRDSHNDVRRFFSPDMQAQFPVMHDVAELFQSSEVVRSIESMCGVKLAGSYLRIEYCQDKDGFWLEPHMDIKEKHITMQIYLNNDSDAAILGTDVYDQDKVWVASAPSAMGEGMVFVPAEPNSWHGFEKRPIKSVRRSLIINYVTNDWRARHELAFPEKPVE